MVEINTPSFSFSALYRLLRKASVSSDEAKTVLEDHKDALFEAVNASESRSLTSSGPSNIKYRPGAYGTESHPEPTASELRCIETIEKGLGVGRVDAAILIRDFLVEEKGKFVSEVLDQSADLMNIAPVSAVETFFRNEKRCAFSCLVVICAGASQKSTHPYYHVFAKFLSVHGKKLKELVLQATSAALLSYGQKSAGKVSGYFENVQEWWVMEALFAYCLHDSLTPVEKEKLMSDYSKIAREGSVSSVMDMGSSDYPATFLDGGEATAFFIAAVNMSHGLIRAVHVDSETMDLESEGPEADVGGTALANDVQTIRRIDAVLHAMRGHRTCESALMSFSWATFLRLRRSLANGDEENDNEGDIGLDPVSHMSHAISINVFAALRRVAFVDLVVDDLIAGELYQCFWVDLIAFLIAFPPQNFSPEQVENIVELSIALLNQTDHDNLQETAECLWERENTQAEIAGPNSLLRLASGIFPRTFRPLVALLTCLTTSQNSAAKATDYLENRLLSLTEHSEAYQSSLIVIDQDDDAQSSESLSAMLGGRFGRALRNLQAVCPDDEKIVYVQAGSDIPGDRYRSDIPKGSLGISDTTLGEVTWILPWDGFGALDHMVTTFLQLLREHETVPSYDNATLEELILSSLDTLKFIDRLCRSGSKNVRERFASNEARLSVITSIVAELSDPGDWARGSWLTKKRREALLTAAASCISSMAIGSTARARRVLDLIGSAKAVLPIQTALSALGTSAFPAVAAVSRIASMCSHGEHLSDGFLRKLSFLSRSHGTAFTSETFEGYRGGANRVHEFLRAVALPLWLTTSVLDDGSPETKSLFWLLPACSLHLFSKRPSDVLNDPAICSVLVAVVTAAGTGTSETQKEGMSIGTFLFPAVQAALVACYEALRERNALLQESNNAYDQSQTLPGKETSLDSRSSNSLTNLEKLLLKPDVIHAMATISAGLSEALRHEKFFTSWAESEFKSFVPDIESSRYLFLNASSDDVIAEKICSWRKWIEDMCARCLALQFCCLSQLSREGDITQVPWPTTDRSSYGHWRGGGDEIRKGYAHRIRQGSTACIELMVTVLSCGQRAAARSLMGPKPRKVEPVKKVRFAETEAVKQGGSDPQDQSRSGRRDSEKDRDEVLLAVIQSLQNSSESWTSKLTPMNTLDDSTKLATLKELGQISLTMATCVRFLRVGWESHSSKWFQDCWKKKDVWGLLSSFLRCEPGRGGGNMDLSKSLNPENDTLSIGFRDVLFRVLKAVSVETVLLRQSITTDIISAWKTIVSDCFRVFSSEILLRASEELVTPRENSDAAGEQADQKERKLPEDIFKDQPFTHFASVFTEHWMHVLLQVDDHYLTGGIPSPEENVKTARRMQLYSKTGDASDAVSVEQRTRNISVVLGEAIGLSKQQAEQSRILYDFRRAGDVHMRFGAYYGFDVPAILNFMKALDVNVQSHQKLFIDILQLNAEISRKDVQVEVVTAFSSMASAVLFADAFAPSQSVTLTYSSPQLGGKLCRFLSRVLVCIMPSISASSHTTAIVSEISKLAASLSAKLSPDELEQAALTSIRFPEPPQAVERECGLTPLGQICFCINRIIMCVQAQAGKESRNKDLLESVRWLLLTAARLVRGPSFRDRHDITELANSAIGSMRCGKPNPRLFAAASVAISAVLENDREVSFNCMFDERAIEAIFTAIASLASLGSQKANRPLACQAAGNLLLTVARIHLTGNSMGQALPSSVLRHLCGGSILTFLPSSSDSIPTYEANLESRNPAHVVWCACLSLSSMVIPSTASEPQSSQHKEQEIRDVLEFCATNLFRIARDSLDISGDWPSPVVLDSERSFEIDPGSVPRHVTIGRVEEAELACVTIFKLSGFALQLQEGLPELLEAAVFELVRFTYHVYRLIRAEPLERWVRPVTQRERDRSQLLRSERDGAPSNIPGVFSPSPWNMSPAKSAPPGSNSPQRRSPSQALRAAIGGSGNRGRFSPGFVPPSPGMPPTPLQSPATGVPGSQGSQFASPGSPWGPYGAGLITTAGLKFGEEAARSLLRSLGYALGALRRFSETLDVVLFKPTMVLSEETLGIGVLVAIQYHACNEICRGAEDERRDTLQMIIDNALYLTVTHALKYDEQGLLTQGVKDELRKRVNTVRARMQKLVPPVPSFSMIHSKQLEMFLHQLKGST